MIAPRHLLETFLAVLLGGGDGPIPKLGELNSHILRAFESYPRDGSHGYWWPRGSSWEGTTRDLVYLGEKVATGDPRKRSYCSGFTFEVFFRAYESWCEEEKVPFRIGKLNAATIGDFRRAWYGSDGDRRTLAHALVDFELGTLVEKWEEAKPGDFVQLWRHDGSGHSAIFLEWKKNGSEIAGIRYGSSQKSTGGIGVAAEDFGDSGRAVDRNQVYLVRVGRGAGSSR
jgi:hypothetical protein